METPVVVPAKKSGAKKWIVLIIVALVVAGGAYAAFTMMPTGSSSTGTPTVPATTKVEPARASEYQAVFLTNSQVYFGKISNSMGSQFVELEDIYYLQVQPQAQTSSKDKQAATGNNISLIKLGGEPHGPTDKMFINRDQILLIEDLRTDSNLVKAIENYQLGAKTAGQ